MSKLQVGDCEELSSGLAPMTRRGLSWSARVGKKGRVKEKSCITNYPFSVNEYDVNSQSGTFKCQLNAEKQSQTGALQALRKMQAFLRKAQHIYNSILLPPCLAV